MEARENSLDFDRQRVNRGGIVGVQFVAEVDEAMQAAPGIFVIDDDQMFREEICETLAEDGVSVAYSARHGIETQYRLAAAKPAAVLIAVEEPFARALLPHVPIVAYSTSKDPKIARRLIQAGVSDLVSLPATREELATLAANLPHCPALGSGARPSGGLPGPREATANATVLAVVGQKGGVGKTTLSTNLASAIARSTDSSVLLIDVDIRFGDVGVMMDLQPEVTAASAAREIAELDRETFRDLLVEHESGAYVLAAPVSRRHWVTAEAADVEALVDFAAQMFDCVILDTPGTMNSIVAAAIGRATQVIAVTSADVTSLKNTDLLLHYLEAQRKPRHRVLVALTETVAGSTADKARVEEALQTPVDWQIPYDRATAVGCQTGSPVVLSHPRSRASQNYLELAAGLTGRPIAARPERQHRWLPFIRLGRAGATARRRSLVSGRA